VISVFFEKGKIKIFVKKKIDRSTTFVLMIVSVVLKVRFEN